MSKRPFFQRYSLTPVGPGGVRIALSLVALSVATLALAALALAMYGTPEPPAGDMPGASSAAVASPLAGAVPPGDIPAGQSVPFDIGAIIEQVHFAYAPEGHDFVAGHTTYGVRVIDGTSVAIRPYHSPAGQDERLEPARGSRHKDGRRNHRRAPRVPAIEGEPLELETVALERGGIPIEADDAEASPRVAQDGSLEIPRSGALERLRNHDDGVEQSWSFSERPEGDGDLVVSVAVSGQEPVGETEQGLHFEDPDTGLGSRYGLVAWFDANGDQTEVPVRYHDGVLSLTIPEALLEVSAYPATVTATVSGELGMDNPVTTSAIGPQFNPDVAYGNGMFLVCWEDQRRESEGDIYCARIKNGSLLDTAGLPVSTAPDAQSNPSVASDGSSFVVIWGDRRNRESSGTDIYGAQVTTTGTITSFTVSKASNDQDDPSIAFNGSQYLAVWTDDRTSAGEYNVYGKRFHPSSSDSIIFAISASADMESEPDVACDGTNCLVVWRNSARTSSGFLEHDIFGRSVSASGALGLTLDLGDGEDDEEHPAVAFGGGTYLVALVAEGNDGLGIYATRVSTAFAVSSTTSFVSYGRVGENDRYFRPAIAFDSVAKRFLVVWHIEDSRGGFDIYGSRVTTSGGVEANFVITGADKDQSSPAVAFDGSCMLVAMKDSRGGPAGSDISGARVCATTVHSISRISSSANFQFNAAVAFDGTNYMVVWADFRNGTSTDITGTRVSPAGKVLNTSGIKVAPVSGDQETPDLACDGTNCLVCWTDLRSYPYYLTYCTRIASATGTVIDTYGFQLPFVGGLTDDPAVAFDGTNYLVVWADLSSSGKYDVYGSFVTQSAFMSAPINISDEPSRAQYAADVAFDPTGGNYLVVWEDRSPSFEYDIYGALVTKSGQVAPSVLYHPTAGEQTAPTVAFAGSNFHVIWEDTRNGTADLYGALVTAANAVKKTSVFASSTNSQRHPSIASNGTENIIVWEELSSTSLTWDIMAMRLDSAGGLLEKMTISASTSVDEVRPVVAFGAAGQAMVAYDRFDSSASIQSNRVKARFVTY